MRAARAAVADGAIPFSVQGPDNGLAVEGARTLAFEMAEALADAGAEVDALLVQVGGGAFASALAQGFAIAAAAGLIKRAPRLIAVQTAGCAPLARAWRRLAGREIGDAARRRSQFMWPWESEPKSLAHGILDDETYDWLEVAKAMRATGGDVLDRRRDGGRQGAGPGAPADADPRLGDRRGGARRGAGRARRHRVGGGGVLRRRPRLTKRR